MRSSLAMTHALARHGTITATVILKESELVILVASPAWW
jgi:hypothetical protein